MSMFCGQAEDEQNEAKTKKQQVWILHPIRCASLSWQTRTRCHIASQAGADRHIIFLPLHPFFTLHRVERHVNAATLDRQSNVCFMGALVPRCGPNRRVQARLRGSHYTLQSAF